MLHHSFKPLVLASLVCCANPTAQGQSAAPNVIANAGAYFQNGNGSIAWTLGEPVINTQAVGSVIITQGFHQPDDDFGTAIVPHDPASQNNIRLFPNPTRDQVVLLMSSMGGGGASYTLLDGLGRRIAEQGALEERTIIDLDDYANGNYLLRVTDPHGMLLETFKLTIAK